MAESNIYDLVISELILRSGNGGSGGSGGSGSSSSTAQIKLTNSLNTQEVQEFYNGSITYTSTVLNMPVGYSVKSSTHIISYPGATPSTVSSVNPAVGAPLTLIVGAMGSTFVVNATVTLEKTGSADIVLVGTSVITAVLPLYFGVKAFSVPPTTTSLFQQANSNHTFILTNSILGRLYIAIPTLLNPIISVTDQNSNVWFASDFTVTTVGSFEYYVLNWDILLSGPNLKYFTINFS
jgi:hypothetical protein